MPTQGLYYSVNEANSPNFSQQVRAYLLALRDGSLLHFNYGARYVGSFIADLHRTLLKGGVFLYPATSKAPNGKLRLLYEANPLAMLVEQAGGLAITGVTIAGQAQRILDIEPRELHQRTPLLIGGAAEVNAFARADSAG